MRNLVLVFCVFYLAGCMKDDQACTPVSPQSEEAAIMAFATAQSLTTIKLNNGIHYQVLSTGYGARPTLQSEVTVDYTGRLLDGSIFDQNSHVKNTLNKFIEGWQIGLPLIQKGGAIRLVIPSAYAYGCIRNGNIPPNSILYYEINLVDVK